MKDMITNTQRIFYEDPKKWGKVYHQINLDRASLTAQAVPGVAKNILEVGSGDGLILNALREAGHDPVAFDISRNALKHIKGGKLVQGTASRLPFSSNSFDLVLACEVLEHIPNHIYKSVLEEIARVAKKYILITVPYRENLEWSFARCTACGCIFNGSYHVRSFDENDIKFLFNNFKCISLKEIVKVLHSDRTPALELFIRHHMAHEYLYIGPSVKCPLCLSAVREKPGRNWIGWIASGIRYFYRILDRKMTPLWYLSVYQKRIKDKRT
jgi:ubiquinone/menaquinone biosynthesis C-methylase UbiE